jgi:tetratricopeptide (TPR) repeat protein
MSRTMPLLVLLIGTVLGSAAQAQLITMSKECRASVASGDALNANQEYSRARELFAGIAADCDSKDGVDAIQVGLAHAQNGLRNYSGAIEAANVALENSKQTSINALFERAVAEEALGNPDAAEADYEQIIQLTEMNQNLAQRATIYAKVADMKYRSGNRGAANTYLTSAIELDPGNPDFYAQRADWAAVDGDYAAAFRDLDDALARDDSDTELYAMRSDLQIKLMQDKYGTENVQELRGKMTADETAQVCTGAKAALDRGLRNMQLDMFVALVCR